MRTDSLDPSHAVLALEDASDREEIFEVLLRAARSRTRYAALLSVHTEELRGRKALGDGVIAVDTARIEALRIPRNAVPVLETAIASRAPSVGPIATGEPFLDGLLEQIGGPSPMSLVLPVAVGARTVALIVAHRGRDGAFSAADVADLFPLIGAASPALARVLAARSKAAPPRAEGYAEIEVVVPTAAKRRATLSDLRGAAQWEEVTDGLRDLIREGVEHGDPDEDEQLTLLLELGTIEAERLGRPERAIEAWRSAQAIDAGDPRVLDALQALFVQQGMWGDCADVIEKRAALTDDAARRIPVLLELAAIAHERLEDDERAIAAYERILHWDPDHELASRQLEELYSARQQWEPLAALLLDRASRRPDPEVALEAVARMYEDKVGDLRAAFLVWLAVFRRAPDRGHLIDQLERIGPLANAWDEILAEGSALAEELEAAHPAAAKEVWQLVGTWLRDHTGNRDEAAHAFDRAVQLGPTDRATLQDLTELLRADARWVELARLLRRRAEAETDREVRCELLVELAGVNEHELGEPGEAAAAYERARADEPESRAALDGLHRLYRQAGRWQTLVELIPHLVAVCDPASERERMLDLHCERGDVLSDHLNQPEDAVAAFNAALALDPKHANAFAGIARVYRATGQTEPLLDATEAELDAGGRELQLRRYGEIATAWHQRGRYDRAVACWQKLIAIDPDNLGAHAGLVAGLRSNEHWASLVPALRAQLDSTTGSADRVAILGELGEVLATHLDDVDGAIASYKHVLTLDRDHRAALDALGTLYDRAGQLPPALAALQRLLELTTTDARARADLFQRIGHLYLNARDAANARLHLKQALALDLESAGAHEGMGRLHLMQDELVAAGEELVRAAAISSIPGDKLRCLADAAWLFRHRLHDTERARQCLHLILELEPEHADAKQALAELLHDTKQWETLWPHLEQEVQRAKGDPSLPAKDRLDAFLRAARCALELDRFTTALELFDAAAALDPSPPIQIERAEALYRSKSLDAAAAAYQTVVLRNAQALDKDTLIAVYRRLAEIHGTLGKPAQAQLFHQKVLDLEPRHTGTLRDLADLNQSRGRYDEAIANLRSVLEVTPSDERVSLLERIGDLYRDKLKNPPRAMSTYLEALELDAGNRRLLQRVLELQSEAGQWKTAVETIGRFLEHETDPARRGAYHIAAAEIRRTELRDKTAALDDYDHALDELLREDPLSPATRTRALDVFTIVDELVTADKNWKYQEQTYRRMIKRMPQGDPALVALWHALGEVYRTRLKHYKSAIEAFEVAHSLDAAKSTARGSILAELYALVGTGTDTSQVSRRAAHLVASDPTHPDAYRALGRTSLEAGKIDQAWCVARALVFAKQATADEQALYKRYQAQETTKATGILDDDAWSLVRHPEEDRAISSILGLVWEGPVALRAGPAKAFEIKAKERLPVEDATRVIAKIFRHAARVLNVALPDVYVQPRRSGRLLLANCIEKGRLVPAVIVGRDLMTGYRDTELAAAVGTMLALLKPAYYLKLALPSIDELEAALGAAAQLVGRATVGRPELEPLRATFAAEMQKRLTRQGAEAIRALVPRIPERPDLARWRAAVDTAAQRAGLLVAGELAAAARMLSTETSIGGARPNQRIADLVSYSVSPEYFAARSHLGIAIG